MSSTRIQSALERACDLAGRSERCPPRFREAMRAAVLEGGGRIRPRLTLAVSAACGEDDPALTDAAAAAIELVHCASLVHDDLPCFDDAAFRRGRPSIQHAFGPATAVLVGDALIVLAFQVIARTPSRHPERIARLVSLLADGVGAPRGICAGQAWELEDGDIDLARYHQAKTGALFVSAAAMGAVAAGADPHPWQRVAAALGEAYQVADDLADALADARDLGKPVGQDVAHVRPSAVHDLGVAGARARLETLVDESLDAIPGEAGGDVARLVEYAVGRLVRATAGRAAVG